MRIDGVEVFEVGLGGYVPLRVHLVNCRLHVLLQLISQVHLVLSRHEGHRVRYQSVHHRPQRPVTLIQEGAPVDVLRQGLVSLDGGDREKRVSDLILATQQLIAVHHVVHHEFLVDLLLLIVLRALLGLVPK